MKIHYFEHYATNNSYWYREHPGNDRDGYVSLEDAQSLYLAMADIFAICPGVDVHRQDIRRIAKRAILAVGGPPIIVEQPDDEGDED